jgi:hypothetical protein
MCGTWDTFFSHTTTVHAVIARIPYLLTIWDNITLFIHIVGNRILSSEITFCFLRDEREKVYPEGDI